MKTTENCFLNRLAWFAHDNYLSRNYNNMSIDSDEYKKGDEYITKMCERLLRAYGERKLLTESECVYLLARVMVEDKEEVKGK